MKATQCDRIVKYINDFGSITQLDALRDLGCMRLASRISELKKAGVEIEKRTVAGKNRYGETVRFAEYRIKKQLKEVN